MKKLLLAVLLLLTHISLFSQTFNDGKILRPGNISVAINPVLENKLPGVYFRGGYGIVKSKRKMDISFYAGAHALKNYGLDVGLAAGFTLNTHMTFFTGLDADLNFNINHDRFFWLPLGLKIYLSPRTRFILEGDLPLVEFAPGIVGGGFAFYLD
jgi:hypothetical protein